MRVAQTLRYLIGPLELIHEQAGPRLLRLVRLGVFGLWIVKLLLDPIWRLAQLPHELFRPTGILAVLPGADGGILDPTFLVSFYLVALFVLLACLTNRAFVFFSTTAAILLTIYSSLVRSFGPAVHTDIILLLAVYALALFALADFFEGRRSPLRRSSVPAWSSYPLITIAALLCLSYCVVGLNRTLVGGVRVFTGDTMEVWTIDASLRGYYFNTNIGWHVPEWPWVLFMLKSGLPFITLFEITAPLCLVSSHYRWVFFPVMLLFHLLSLVFMNIFFFDDMFLYLLLIDWSRRFPARLAPAVAGASA